MKKTLALILALIMLVCFASCTTEADSATTTAENATTAADASTVTEAPATTADTTAAEVTTTEATTAEVTTAEITTAEVTTAAPDPAEELRAQKIALYSSALASNLISLPTKGFEIESKSALATSNMIISDSYFKMGTSKAYFEILLKDDYTYCHINLASDTSTATEGWGKSVSSGSGAEDLMAQYSLDADETLLDDVLAIDYLDTENGIDHIVLSFHDDEDSSAIVQNEVYIDYANKKVVKIVASDTDTGTVTTIVPLEKEPSFTWPADTSVIVEQTAEDMALTLMGAIFTIAFSAQ